MWRVFALCCAVAVTALADERWIQFNSGPYQLLTDAGSKSGRETLVKFEQFRNALGQTLGEADLGAEFPVRILVFKVAGRVPGVARGRDTYNVVLNAGSPVPASVFQVLTRLFLEWNTARMPDYIERGLLTLFSTVEITGIRTTLGKPPAPPERTLEWARVHLLATNPEYYGKLRVIIYNLRKGVDPEPAYRNAIGKTPQEIDREARRYLAAGNFPTFEPSSKPMSERDLAEKQVSASQVRLALADLLDSQSRPAYESMLRDKENVAEAQEGLGLLDLKEGRKDEARQAFAAAIAAETRSVRACVEYARLEPNNDKAMVALRRAAGINPKIAEPHYMMAEREKDPRMRIAHLKTAASLNPRNGTYWQKLAEAYLEEKDFAGAARAWSSAEQAAVTPEEHARMQQNRLAIEQQRLDYEAAERRRKAEEEQRAIEKLKAEARAEVRALEARANQASTPAKPDEVVPWWEGPKPSGQARGILRQIDCLGKQFRLTVLTDEKKTVKLLIADPGKIAIIGGGDHTLSCGPQKDRRLSIEYFPKANPKLATAGEVATIEFQ